MFCSALLVASLIALTSLSIVASSNSNNSAFAGTFPGPNGQIAFTSTRDGNYEIYAMNPDGSGQTNLSNNPGNDENPSWSPDGEKIAFLSLRDGEYGIFTMNADGSGQTRITDTSASYRDPSWSPDGTKIAFESFVDGSREIYVMNADGTERTRLTNDSGADEGPSWSPDGAKIAFSSTRDGPADIFIMNPDGTGQTNLNNSDDSHDFTPSWSPDSTKIVFRGNMDGPKIFVMNADGTERTVLADSGSSFDPDWGTNTAILGEGPPKTPSELVTDLKDFIKDMSIPKSLKTSLLGPLTNAEKILTDSDPTNDVDACSKLDDFISSVEDKVGKKGGLTQAQGDELIDTAEDIKEALGC